MEKQKNCQILIPWMEYLVENFCSNFNNNVIFHWISVGVDFWEWNKNLYDWFYISQMWTPLSEYCVDEIEN